MTRTPYPNRTKALALATERGFCDHVAIAGIMSREPAADRPVEEWVASLEWLRGLLHGEHDGSNPPEIMQ